MMFTIYRSPEGDGDAGGDLDPNQQQQGDHGAAPVGDQSAKPPDPAPAGKPAATLTAAREAARQQAGKASEQSGGAAASGPAKPAWLKDGKVFQGRYDRDGHIFTPEFIEANPHVKALVENHDTLNREYSALKNGHYDRLAIKDDALDALDFTPDADGKLPKATTEALLGKPVTPRMIELMGEAMGVVAKHYEAERTQWQGAVDQRHGEGTFQAVQDWLTDPDGPYTDEQLAKFDAAFADPDLRDGVIDSLVMKFNESLMRGQTLPRYTAAAAHDAAQRGVGGKQPMEVSNTAGGGGGEAPFETKDEALSAFRAASGQPELEAAWERRVARSPKVVAAIRQMMAGPSL